MSRAYSIEIDRDALRFMSKLDKPIRRRVQTAIDRLADEPRPHGVRASSGHHGLLRLRVGDYRVVYLVKDTHLVVLIVDIGHRGDIYRNLDR